MHLAQTASWRSISRRLSATAYSIYSQLSSLSETVPLCSVSIVTKLRTGRKQKSGHLPPMGAEIFLFPRYIDRLWVSAGTSNGYRKLLPGFEADRSSICTCNIEIKLLKTKRNLLYIRTQSVPRSKHSPLRLHTTYLLMLYKETVHTEHLNAM